METKPPPRRMGRTPKAPTEVCFNDDELAMRFLCFTGFQFCCAFANLHCTMCSVGWVVYWHTVLCRHVPSTVHMRFKRALTAHERDVMMWLGG